MSKHTPKPWVWRKDYCGLENPEIKEFVLAYESYEGMSLDDYPGTGREEANAKLIAAAPDLLEAITALVRQMRSPPTGANGYHEIDLSAADAAIAKATGGKQ